MKNCLKYLLVYLSWVIAPKTLAIENPDALELLNKFKETQNKMQSVILKGECLIEYNDSRRGQILRRDVYEMGTDGDRVGLIINIWSNLNSFDNPFKEDNALFRNYVWDGERCFDYAKRGSNDGRAFITYDDTSKPGYMSVGYMGSPLRGVFSGDILRVDEILQKAESIKVRNEREEVNGSLCYIIDATTQHGQYSVWFDTEHDYNIARAEVIKKDTDIAWGKPLNWKSSKKIPQTNIIGQPYEAKKGFSFSLNKVSFKDIEGVWVPVSADYEYTKAYEDGVVATSKNHYTHTHIDINPDFEASGIFKPKIENDAAIYIEGANFAYRWLDGEIVPKIDKYVIDEMDRITDELLDEGKVHSGPPTDQKTEAAPNERATPIDTESQKQNERATPIDTESQKQNERATPIDTESKKQVDTVESTAVILSESRSSLVLVLILIGLPLIGIIIWLVLRLHKA